MLCVLTHDCLQTCNNRNMSQCTVFDKVASCVLSSAVLCVCGQTTSARRTWGFLFMVNSRSIDDIDAWFSKVIQLFSWRFDAWLVHMPHQLSRWCPATIISQMSCCSTLTLLWSRGEKRCCTSLGPCWWRAARPIRRCSVSHHVPASPIAIYFTISQMKRLILTICSLTCFSLSFFSLLHLLTHFSLLHSPGCKVLALA